MASLVVSRYIGFLLFSLCALRAESGPVSFSLEKFENDTSFGSQIALYGEAEIGGDSAVLMFGKGRMMFKKPIRFLGTNPGFSTNFSFSISAGNDETLAFLLVPNNLSLISADGEKLGASPRFLAVKFGSFVVLDVGGEISVKSSNLSLSNEQKLQAWINYDGVSKIIEVRVCEKPVVSYAVDLSNLLWSEPAYVGISSSSGNSTTRVYSWSFKVKHGVPYLMHSEPLDPESVSVRSRQDPMIHARRSSSWKILVALLVGAVSGALVASAVFLLRSRVAKRHPVAPVEYQVPSMQSEEKKIVLDGIMIFGGNAGK